MLLALRIPSVSFQRAMPSTHAEIKRWEKVGLIPPFSKASLIDVIAATVLKVVREHLEEDK